MRQGEQATYLGQGTERNVKEPAKLTGTLFG